MQTSMHCRSSVGSSSAAPQRCSCRALPHAKPFLTGESHLIFVSRHARRSLDSMACCFLADPAAAPSVRGFSLPTAGHPPSQQFWHAAGRHRLRSAWQASPRTDRGHQVAVHAALVPRFTRVVKGYTFFYGDAAGECCPATLPTWFPCNQSWEILAVVIPAASHCFTGDPLKVCCPGAPRRSLQR